MRKLALSMRVTEASNYFETRNSLAFEYIEFFERLGFLVIPVPNNSKHIEKYIEELDVDGIVLTGGNNVNPSLYNGIEELESVYKQRDEVEGRLLDVAVKNNIPLLGICRGFHYINVHFGGTISHDVKNHVKKDHILISQNTLLNDTKTNSYHNQAILKHNLSSDFDVIAFTKDNVIETIYHKEHKILGVQWHPERQKMEQDKELILDFFNK